MPNWRITIQLASVLERWRRGHVEIPALAALVAEQIKTSRWAEVTSDPDELAAVLEKLLLVTSSSEYRAAFEAIYDLADQDRVWIETF